MQYTFCCLCLMGLEGLVAEELRDMGCANVRAENGRVLFDGDMQMMARANINSRYAERVVILLKTFEAKSFEELFQQVKAIPWEAYLDKADAFPVKGGCLSSTLHSVPDCQAIIKKAIVERMKQKHHVEWFSEEGPEHKIRFRILKDQVSMMMDTSGAGLHKRGYRKHSTEAPIKETLAAAMAKLARVRTDANFIDPFCGSGTILIEAAMQALRIAPGLNRKFQAENWLNTPKKFWTQERELARANMRKENSFHGSGFDIDPAAVALTLENAKKAGVLSHVEAAVRDIQKFEGHARYGCVVCNPPYGERLLSSRDAEGIYRTMGRMFVQKPGWSYTVITPSEQFEMLFGRKADKRRKLYNGMIPCQVYLYFK